MFIYGTNSIIEALRERIELSSIYIDKTKKKKFFSIVKEAEGRGLKINYTFEKEIEKLSHSQKHQGICAEIKLPDNIIEDENNFTFTEEMKKILILDGITDTGNLGAIIRSALLLKADLIILPKDNSARITPQVIKSSAGAVYKQKILYVNNLNTTIISLKEEEYSILGFAGEGEKNITDFNTMDKIVCIIGSEHKGLRKSTKKLCDELVKIPTTGKLDSLNASVASAIAMWELFMKGDRC